MEESWADMEESGDGRATLSRKSQHPSDGSLCRGSQHLSVDSLCRGREGEGKEEGTGDTLLLLLLLRLRQLRHELGFLDTLDILRNPFLGVTPTQEAEHTQLSDAGSASELEDVEGYSEGEDEPAVVGNLKSWRS